MKRSLLAVLVFGIAAVAGTGGCDKPSADDCRAAIANMKRLQNIEQSGVRTAETESEVRRCQGGSTKASVACRKNASTLAELKACDGKGKGAATSE